jgi:hypothetical protein
LLRTVQKAQILLRSGGQFFDFFAAESWRARAGFSRLFLRSRPHPLSPVKSDSLSLAALFWVAAVKSEIAGSRGHGCLKFCDLVGHARCGCTGATSGFLSGSTPRGLAGVHQLPMLGLLGRGKTIVDVSGVMFGLDIGHLVDLLLRDEPASTRVTTMSTATAGPAAALTATSTSLSKGQNGAALGNNVILLQALEVAIKVHDRVEVP